MASKNETRIKGWIIFRTGLATVLCVLLFSSARLAWLSQRHYSDAQAARAVDAAQAMRSYSWVARNYFPGNPYVSSSIEDSLALADEMGGVEAANGLKNLRASLYAIRSLYQPYADELAMIETRLAKYEGGHAD